MNEGVPKQFSSPEEELTYLRERIAARERELLSRNLEADPADTETIGRQEIKEYASFTPQVILAREHALDEPALAASVEQVSLSHDPVEDILNLAKEKGVRNALSVLDKMQNAYVVDEVHRQIVAYIRTGASMQDLKEGVAPWHILHMTLYEVTLSELIGMMEQLFAGLRTIGSQQMNNHFVIEIAVADNSDDIVFYVAVPNQFVTLFEKQTLSLFPYAELVIQAQDYNVFVDNGVTVMTEVALKKHPIYPIRTVDGFSSDPLAVILNAFSKIEREGGGAALQFVMRHPQKRYRKDYEDIIKNMQKGMKASDAISRSTISGQLMASVGDLFSSKKKDELNETKEIDSEKIEVFGRKIKSDIIETNIRIAVSAKDAYRAEQIQTEIESTFNQFELLESNSFVFNPPKLH